MIRPVSAALGLLFSVSALLVRPGAADPTREIVVVLRPAAPAARAALERGFADRCAARGLRIARRLDEGLPAAAAPGRAADPFALDPARVVLVEAAEAADAAAARQALVADPAVAWTEPNAARGPAVEWIGSRVALPGRPALDPAFPNDPLFRDGRQWGLRNLGPAGPYGGVAGADIHALGAWAVTTGSNDVLLGVADTGIDPAQPDLAATLPDGSSRIEFAYNATAGPEVSVLDTYGHGTPVAGVIAARTNDGPHFDSLGVAGVCGGDGAANYGCHIVPIKITRDNSGDASSFDVARAIFYATRAGCRAMNLSFAGDAPSGVERAALHYAMQHGCVVVAAAGNKGYLEGTLPQYPAAYAADGLCIQVGASDESDRRAVFSSYGPGLDLVAPGVDIWTTFMTYPSQNGASYPGYVPAAGTSFAAPFVTGTIGLMAAARPDLDASDYQHLLDGSADDVGVPGPDAETGHGRLNAAAALASVGPEFGLWHDEVAAGAWSVVATETVRVDRDAPPAALAWTGWHRAERVEATATIAIPDSFTDDVRVWPRIGGTSTIRGAGGPLAFTPWAEAIPLAGRRVMLRGTIYRVTDASADPPEDAWIPVPPDQARFGFTVIGRVRREAGAAAAGAAAPRLAVAPNPARGAMRLTGPAGAPLLILDVSGRVVARGALDGAGSFTWGGRDPAGRRVAPGLYLARVAAAGRTLTARIVRIE